MRRFLTALGLLCFMWAVSSGHLAAMTVEPAVIDMAVAGKEAKSSVQVVNDGTKPLPVEFQISKIELDAKGERLEKPAADEFLVFPPQAMIPPGSTQVFRIQWAGGADLKNSQSYIFSVNQIPVKLKKEQSGIQLVFNFGVVVNVAPLGGVAALKYVGSEIGKDDKGVRRPSVTVENTGTMHAYLSEASLILEGGGWRHSITGAEIRQTIGLGLVQPGKQRRFLLPVDLPATVTQLTARVDYKPKTAR